MKFDKVSFAIHFPMVSSMGKQQTNSKEKKGTSKSIEYSNMGEPSSSLSCYSLEALEAPPEAMEFLSRSWSKSSIDFYEIFSLASKHFSPKNLQSMLPSISEEGVDNASDKAIIIKGGEEQEREKEEMEEMGWAKIHNNKHISIGVDDIKMWLSTGRLRHEAIQRRNLERKNWMKVSSIKALLTEAMGKLSIEYREKRRENMRVHTAQMHAALSVAGVAAAVAGFAARSSLSENNNSGKESLVMASATALLAAVCAEAAEGAGAPRAYVSSVVSSALAAPNPADIDALIAAAATCLRGVATLKSRITSGSDVSNGIGILTKGAQLRVRIPPGKSRHKTVQVYLKHNMPFLRLGTKYLGGFLSRTKDYRINHVIEEPSEVEEAEGLYLLSLITTRGATQIVFEDGKERSVWGSTITQLLANQGRFSLINS